MPEHFRESTIHFADLNYRVLSKDGDLLSQHLGFFFSPFSKQWTRCEISSDSRKIVPCQEYARGPISYISPVGLEGFKESVLLKKRILSARPSI